MSEEKVVKLKDGRIKYIETEEGLYKFNYTDDKILDHIICPDEGKYEFFYDEDDDQMIDYIETPYGTLNFYYTRTGKTDSIKLESGEEFVFYYDDSGEVQIEVIGEIDEFLEKELGMFGII